MEAIRALQVALHAAKFCIRCGRWLPVQNFYLPRGISYSHCSACHRRATADYRKRKALRMAA